LYQKKLNALLVNRDHYKKVYVNPDDLESHNNNSCYETENKKYSGRPSPSRPANIPECHGKAFVGNDGNLWVSHPNKKGIYRWVLATTKRDEAYM
jgi:hypothetical protein